MTCMIKMVHWDHIVLLSLKLSGDAHLGQWSFSAPRLLGEALLRGRRAIMSSASFGERYAESAEGKTPSATQGWAKATPFPYLNARIRTEQARDESDVELDLLRGGSGESPHGSRWLEAIEPFAESDVQRLCWTSATSGASIDCRKTSSGWVAIYTQPGKESQYAQLWADMRGTALSEEEEEDLINPPCTCAQCTHRESDNW